MPNNNDAIIARIKGIPGQVGTPETDADSRNPNVQPVPKLVMGHIEVMGPDGSEGIPYDEAVIHLEGDEDSEINVHCPGALRLAPLIVAAVNNHPDLVRVLKDAVLLIESYSFSIGRDPRKAAPQSVLGQARALLAAVGGSR